MTKSGSKRLGATLIGAHEDLQDLGKLLDEALRVDRDILARIHNGFPSQELIDQRDDFGRMTDRICEAYLLALDRYLAAASNLLARALKAGPLQREPRLHLLPAPNRPRHAGQQHMPARAEQGAIPLLANLERELDRTRADWLGAMGEFPEILKDLPSHIPEPDGSLRMKLVGRRRTETYRSYKQALEKYHQALARSACNHPRGAKA